jgi:hypothetical protein
MQIAHPSGGCVKTEAKGESKNHGNSIITLRCSTTKFSALFGVDEKSFRPNQSHSM